MKPSLSPCARRFHEHRIKNVNVNSNKDVLIKASAHSAFKLGKHELAMVIIMAKNARDAEIKTNNPTCCQKIHYRNTEGFRLTISNRITSSDNVLATKYIRSKQDFPFLSAMQQALNKVEMIVSKDAEIAPPATPQAKTSPPPVEISPASEGGSADYLENLEKGSSDILADLNYGGITTAPLPEASTTKADLHPTPSPQVDTPPSPTVVNVSPSEVKYRNNNTVECGFEISTCKSSGELKELQTTLFHTLRALKVEKGNEVNPLKAAHLEAKIESVRSVVRQLQARLTDLAKQSASGMPAPRASGSGASPKQSVLGIAAPRASASETSPKQSTSGIPSAQASSSGTSPKQSASGMPAPQISGSGALKFPSAKSPVEKKLRLEQRKRERPIPTVTLPKTEPRKYQDYTDAELEQKEYSLKKELSEYSLLHAGDQRGEKKLQDQLTLVKDEIGKRRKAKVTYRK